MPYITAHGFMIVINNKMGNIARRNAESDSLLYKLVRKTSDTFFDPLLFRSFLYSLFQEWIKSLEDEIFDKLFVSNDF